MKKRILVNGIIALIIVAIYEGIGLIFNIDILKIMTFTESSFRISIAGLLLCAITGLIFDLIRLKIKKHN
ncbi:MAG: hypothetical protein Q8865_02130 [Bacillota bacterium]|nr:hypothetical protein [Bacillota bacterium]